MKTKYKKITAKSNKTYMSDQKVFSICKDMYKKYKKAFDILKDK